MKNLTILGALFLSMTILFSCGKDKKSDKDKKRDKFKKEIKDPCDILDYTIEIFEYLEDLADDYDDIDELEDDKKDKKKVDDYFDDLEDAWKYAFKEFDKDMSEVFESDCKNYDEMGVAWNKIDFYEDRVHDFQEYLIDEIGKIKDSDDNKRPRRYSEDSERPRRYSEDRERPRRYSEDRERPRRYSE